MKILVVNAGSSTLKFQLLNTETEELLAKGNVERIGDSKSFLSYKAKGMSEKFEEQINDHGDAMKLVINTLTDQKYGVIKSLKEIEAFGHRIVNAGDGYFDPTLVTEEVLADFKTRICFSPLHMPGAIAGIEGCFAISKTIPNVAVFDVGFHKTMPEYVYRYAIANRYYDDYKIRRYGAHGTSHYFVARECAKFLNKSENNLKIVTCHLGSGASIAAVENGKCKDTSMGFTPIEGIMMNTRSGDIDASVIEFICNKENRTISDVLTELNKKSGLYAINDGVSDMRDLTSPEMKDNEKCKLSLQMYTYRVKKYIGSYVASMNGIDALVFTAGIGENTPELRESICENMDFFGIKIDNDKNWNAKRGEIVDISATDSKVKVLIIPTNEELVIAEQTEEVVKNKK